MLKNLIKVNSNGFILGNVDRNLYQLCLYIYENFDHDLTHGISKNLSNPFISFEEFPCDFYVPPLPTTSTPLATTSFTTTTSYYDSGSSHCSMIFTTILSALVFNI
jgi:hypothetical protein